MLKLLFSVYQSEKCRRVSVWSVQRNFRRRELRPAANSSHWTTTPAPHSQNFSLILLFSYFSLLVVVAKIKFCPVLPPSFFKMSSKVLVNPRQKGNPTLSRLVNVPWQFEPQLQLDFEITPSCGALFLR